jgi:hypothetical protein
VSITPSTGLHANVPYDSYAAWDAANISKLKAMRKSPLHCKYAIENPREETEALLMGLALHAAVFEPAKFETGFAVIPKFDRRTKDGKAAHEEAMRAAAGKTAINEELMGFVQAMASSISNSRAASRFIAAPGQCELSVLWKDSSTGLNCKARFDKLATLSKPVIVELKSTKDASPSSFAKDIANFGYAAQAAFYSDAHKIIHGTEASHVFIAVENQPPHAVAVYMLEDASIQTGRVEYRRWLDLYADCVRSAVWPGYPDKIQTLDMPIWAQRNADHE